jgi:rubrerythrin
MPVSALDEAPTADVEPVRHSTWRLETDEEMPNPMFKLVVCNECGKTANHTYNYCPNCGAKMDGGKE